MPTAIAVAKVGHSQLSAQAQKALGGQEENGTKHADSYYDTQFKDVSRALVFYRQFQMLNTGTLIM